MSVKPNFPLRVDPSSYRPVSLTMIGFTSQGVFARNLVFYTVLGNLLFLVSCTNSISPKKENIPLAFIEDFLENGGDLKKIKDAFGEPAEKIKFKGDKEKIYYKYTNRKNQRREWNFAVDKNEKLTWINYSPWNNPLLDRVEVLPTTLKKYNCQKKREIKTINSHAIKEVFFFECVQGRIRADYNVHGEIRNIAVARER